MCSKKYVITHFYDPQGYAKSGHTFLEYSYPRIDNRIRGSHSIGMEHEEFFRIDDGSVPKEYERMVQRCLKPTPGDLVGCYNSIVLIIS